ncbi:MAG: Crp/Fnr family transcriptional regulator [Bacteroidales bacterium]|jgi:CRP-like cAMP-binding protein|nr:Crp/Fnr family transcriptional regulator [Bacteroidales bacterium]
MTENNTKLITCRDCKEKSCAAAVLNLEEIDLVNENRTETVFRKGDIILHEGSMTSHIIYLKSGLVKEYVKNQNENEQILQIVKKYSYLGLQSLFGDRINHYSYAALENIKVCYIDINVFNQLVRQNGNFAYEILVSISKDNLNNFHRFMRQSQKNTYGRVADALLYFQKIIYENLEFEIPFSRQEFADLIGLSRESATRALTKFKDEGILSIDGRHIGILNLDLLIQINKHG